MSQPLPEIEHLAAFVGWLESTPQTAKYGTASQIAAWFGGRAGIDDQFEAYASFIGIVKSLPDLIDEQFSEDGRRVTALAIVERLRSMLSPQRTALPMESYLSTVVHDRIFVQATLPLLKDMKFGVVDFEAGIPSILSAVEDFRTKLQRCEGLSHASMVVIDAQMALVGRAAVKFAAGGVGEFRDSIFTSVGKIFVELKTNPSNSEEAVREVVDDVIRVFDALEVGGKLIMLGAPLIAGLLMAPKG